MGMNIIVMFFLTKAFVTNVENDPNSIIVISYSIF